MVNLDAVDHSEDKHSQTQDQSKHTLFDPTEKNDMEQKDKEKSPPEEHSESFVEKVKDLEQKVVHEVEDPKERKLLAVLLLLAALLTLGIWGYNVIEDHQRTKPLLMHFQGVREMEEIEFVQFHYREIVPITSKDGKLEFLISVPAAISGKVDMTQLEYRVVEDSTIEVTLPPAILSDVQIDLTQVTDEFDRNNQLKLFLSGGGREYGKAYEAIMNGINTTKKAVLANAIKDDIIARTEREARAYVIRLANSMGYKVRFKEPKRDKSWEKSIEKRLDDKLWKQIKHKVSSGMKTAPVKDAASEVKKGIFNTKKKL